MLREGDSGGPVWLSNNPWAEGLTTAHIVDVDYGSYFSQISLANTVQGTPYDVRPCTSMACS